MPKVLRDAIIAAEDANFYEHEGLDFYGILRALMKNIRAGGIVQGGSTITQQVVKSLLLTPERSIQRKIKEAILAYRLERSLSKEEILYLYLNQIYFGHGAYGVQVAAQNYFGHDVSEVDLAEAALLAGLPRAPSRYSPARKGNTELARERQKYVLEQMLGEGMISQEEVDHALARPILVVEEAEQVEDSAEDAGPISKEEILGQPEPIWILPLRRINTEIAPYFIDTIREHLLKNYGKEKTFCGGLRVYTTLREEDQQAAQEAVQFGVDAYLERQPGKAAEEADNPIDGALLAIDLPDGYVRAMVGGLDHGRSQYNCAVQARRQPGSAVKPLIYGAALDKGYTPATIIVDSPLVFNDPVLEEKWKPKNYSRYFVGPTTLRDALTHSRNVVTIKILRDIGVSYAIRYARRLGVTSPLSPDLSLALGSSEITLQELLVVYSAFAMEGRRPDPISIHKIVDADGQVLEENHPHAARSHQPSNSLSDDQYARERGEGGHGKGRAVSRSSLRGKDGHHERVQGCLVHRVYARQDRRGLDRPCPAEEPWEEGIRGESGRAGVAALHEEDPSKGIQEELFHALRDRVLSNRHQDRPLGDSKLEEDASGVLHGRNRAEGFLAGRAGSGRGGLSSRRSSIRSTRSPSPRIWIEIPL